MTSQAGNGMNVVSCGTSIHYWVYLQGEKMRHIAAATALEVQESTQLSPLLTGLLASVVRDHSMSSSSGSAKRHKP